jgi:ubiquinone biosynthesis protein
MATFAQRFRNVGRITQIINVFVRYGFRKELQSTELKDYVDAAGRESGVTEEPASTLSGAQRLAMAFEELGPTFVKLGQLLAAREDVLPRHVVNELKRLQDRAKPMPFETIERILAEEFPKFKDVFEAVESIPLGAASIGQVHKARLKDGRDVVVKVQRPEIDNLIKTDLSILKSIASFLESVIPEVRLLRPTVVVEELARSLQAELDYFREAGNTERMRALFDGHPRIYVPAIVREHCTRRVLCMEAISGRKLTGLDAETSPVPPTELVRTGVQAFLDMTFKFGMFHADLHPGNFILMENGRLAILDFGLTARLTREVRNTLSFMFLALVREDLESFARLFMELTEQRPDTDSHTIEHEVREVVDTAFNLPLRELQIGRLFMQVARVAASGNAPVTRELVLFFRALIALESFGKSLDPNFEVLKEAVAYAKDLPGAQLNRKFLEQESVFMLRDSQALLKELPFTMRLLAKRLQAGSLHIRIQSDELIFLGKEIDRASNRMSLALFLGALVLGSSILTFDKQGRLYDSLSTLGLVGFGVAGFVGLWLAVSILRSGRFR